MQTELQPRDSTTPAPPQAPSLPGWPGQWLTSSSEHAPGLPAPIQVTSGEHTVLHWPDHYAAVALPDTPRDLQGAWEDRGYTFVRFHADTAAWPALFQRLRRLLGH